MINGLSFDYINRNSRSVYVFLHGWGMNKKSFDNIKNKIVDNSVLTVDLYGFGESDKPKDYFDVYEYAYQIFLLLKNLNINSVILVGHSFGGRLAIILSGVFCIDIDRCYLCASAGVKCVTYIEKIKIIKFKIYKKLVYLNLINKNVLKNFGSTDYKNADGVMKSVFVKVVNQDLLYLAKFISCKTIIVWDKKDKETPYSICKKLHSEIKKSEVVLFNNGGHFAIYVNFNKFYRLIIKK